MMPFMPDILNLNSEWLAARFRWRVDVLASQHASSLIRGENQDAFQSSLLFQIGELGFT